MNKREEEKLRKAQEKEAKKQAKADQAQGEGEVSENG